MFELMSGNLRSLIERLPPPRRFEESDIPSMERFMQDEMMGRLQVCMGSVSLNTPKEHSLFLPGPDYLNKPNNSIHTRITHLEKREYEGGKHLRFFFDKGLFSSLYAYKDGKEVTDLGIPLWTTWQSVFQKGNQKGVTWAHLAPGPLPEYKYLMRQGLMIQLN